MNEMINLKTEVDLLIADTERTHRYSMSRIYLLYNRVFGTAEAPQSCASCLIRKVRQLKAWLADQSQEQPAEAAAKRKHRKAADK